jgi:hypothetical protein
MRHLWSFLFGIVAAPVTWVLIAAGQDGSANTITGWVKADSFNWANLIEPAVYLAVAGLLLGLLGTLRISPVGPMVAGLLLVATYAGMFVAPFAVRDAVPANWKLFGDPVPLRLPLENGTLLLVGALLVMATFSVQRWRRWPGGSAATGDEPGSTDWGPLGPAAPAQDTASPTLGYPDPAPQSAALPRDSGTPWGAPPGATAGRGAKSARL